MRTRDEPSTGRLLARARQGDGTARQELLERHRERLLRMIAVRMDGRLARRIDPSDVVQDVLAEAAEKLSDYLRSPPLPFYPWLRQFAWERLVDLYRFHVEAAKRSVKREEPGLSNLTSASARRLANRLVASQTSPSDQLVHEELQRRVHHALDELKPRDREVLILHYLEQLSLLEIAAVLRLTEGAVKSRHMRALLRLRERLDAEGVEDT